MLYRHQVLIFFICFICLSFAKADERILPAWKWKKMGYQVITRSQLIIKAKYNFDIENLNLPFSEHELSWPVPFASASKNASQNYVNFQQYNGGGAYFHGGCDLRSYDNAPVVSPVSGRLEAGYYGYSTNDDGSMVKQWKPWTGRAHDDPYFEIAVITDSGYRFEYHHVNSLNIPESIIEKLKSTNSRVEKGETVGFVNGGPFHNYEHLHYNIISPDGVRLNPEFYSFQIADRTAPTINGVFAVYKNGNVVTLSDHSSVLGAGLSHFVVKTFDRHDQDDYVQTPIFAQLHFASGMGGHIWDFRQILAGAMGLFPDIRSVFTMSLRVGASTEKTWGQYGEGSFLINLPVGVGEGPFEVVIGDTNGNQSKMSGIIQ